MLYRITAEAEYQFVLVLNPMMGNSEGYERFGPFPTKEALKAFYDGEKVEPYSEEGPDMFGGSATKTYRKNFRKGGPLEWMNPLMPSEWEKPGWHNHGVHEVLTGIGQVFDRQPIG